MIQVGWGVVGWAEGCRCVVVVVVVCCYIAIAVDFAIAITRFAISTE